MKRISKPQSIGQQIKQQTTIGFEIEPGYSLSMSPNSKQCYAGISTYNIIKDLYQKKLEGLKREESVVKQQVTTQVTTIFQEKYVALAYLVAKERNDRLLGLYYDTIGVKLRDKTE